MKLKSAALLAIMAALTATHQAPIERHIKIGKGRADKKTKARRKRSRIK
jgi:hypothetical protein